MQSINKYISLTRQTGGRFKNSGSDVIGSLILPWLRTVIRPNSGTITDEEFLENLSANSDGTFTLSLKTLGSRGIMVLIDGMRDEEAKRIAFGPALDIITLSGGPYYIDAEYFDIPEKDVKRLFTAAPCPRSLRIMNIGLKSLKDIRIDNEYGYLNISNNFDLKSFAGGSNINCEVIEADGCKNLTSLKGLGSKEIYSLSVTNCNVKSVEGMKFSRQSKSIRLYGNPNLSITDGGFRDACPAGMFVDELGVDLHVIAELKGNKDYWGRVFANRLYVKTEQTEDLPNKFFESIPGCHMVVFSKGTNTRIRRKIDEMKKDGKVPSNIDVIF